MNGIYFFLSGKLKPWKSCFRNFDDVVEFQSHNLALQVFFYVDMPGLPLFFRMKTFPQFLINENRDLFTKSNSALFVGFQFIGGQTCGFCSNESCTAIPYRASTGPEQGFPCVVNSHREKPVFITGNPCSHCRDPVFITGISL